MLTCMLMSRLEFELPDGNDTKWHAQAPQLLNMTMFAAKVMARSNDSFDVSFQQALPWKWV